MVLIAFVWCFPFRSVVTYKYNVSVDSTTLYLYTKIVYFVRAICFNLIRSSSGPPNILFLYINKVLCYRLTYYIYMHLLFSKQTCLEICVEVVSSISELLSLFVLGHTFPCTLPFEPTHSLSDGMGCKWLVFLILYQLLYTALFRLVTKMSLSESGWSINSIVSSLFSFCCVVCAAVSVETNRNRILLN